MRLYAMIEKKERGKRWRSMPGYHWRTRTLATINRFSSLGMHALGFSSSLW